MYEPDDDDLAAEEQARSLRVSHGWGGSLNSVLPPLRTVDDSDTSADNTPNEQAWEKHYQEENTWEDLEEDETERETREISEIYNDVLK